MSNLKLKTKKLKVFIILPAFNEVLVLGEVLDNLKEELKKLKNIDARIVVVDDGSWDKTGKISKEKGTVVLKHIINRGLGGALSTGLGYAKQEGADIAVTFDSDGQHDPKDIRLVIEPIWGNQTDIVIGIRDKKKMPFDRRLITIFSSMVTWALFGIYCQDTQSGFRAFNKKAINKIEIKTQRMEVSSEFFGEIKKNKFRFSEIPIKVIYTPYSRIKGQSNLNAVKILVKLVLRLFR